MVGEIAQTMHDIDPFKKSYAPILEGIDNGTNIIASNCPFKN